MKGQVTVDFMIAVGMALVFFILLVNAAYGNSRHAAEMELRYSAYDVLETVAYGVDSIGVCGRGCSTTVNLPATLRGGIPYSLTFYPGSVLLNASGRYYGRQTLTGASGTVESGTVRIYYDGGVVVEDA